MLNKASKHDRKLDGGGEVGCILIASPQQTTHQTQHKNTNNDRDNMKKVHTQKEGLFIMPNKALKHDRKLDGSMNDYMRTKHPQIFNIFNTQLRIT